ncbi:unnamed protein product, partial [Ilex paraguariensis]
MTGMIFGKDRATSKNVQGLEELVDDSSYACDPSVEDNIVPMHTNMRMDDARGSQSVTLSNIDDVN